RPRPKPSGERSCHRVDQFFRINSTLGRFSADRISSHQTGGEFPGCSAAAGLRFAKRLDLVETRSAQEFADQPGLVKTERNLVKLRRVAAEKGSVRGGGDLSKG